MNQGLGSEGVAGCVWVWGKTTLFPAWKKSTSGHPGAKDCGHRDKQLYQEKADSTPNTVPPTLTWGWLPRFDSSGVRLNLYELMRKEQRCVWYQNQNNIILSVLPGINLHIGHIYVVQDWPCQCLNKLSPIVCSEAGSVSHSPDLIACPLRDCGSLSSLPWQNATSMWPLISNIYFS